MDGITDTNMESTSRGRALDHDATMRLVTDLHYLGAGEEAISQLQERLDFLTGESERIMVGEISTDAEGRPVCGISFDCEGFKTNAEAEDEIRAILGKVNMDNCVFWAGLEFLKA